MIGTFAVIGIIFVPVGVTLKEQSDRVVEYKCQYDGAGSGNSSSCTISPSCHMTSAMLLELNGADPDVCTIDVAVGDDMDGDVFVYYELHNFYQNHRRYVKSRKDLQLLGEMFYSKSELQDCDPLTMKNDQILSPCGLIANSLFNDVIELTNTDVTMREDDIAWESDRDEKFKQPKDFIRQLADSASNQPTACQTQLQDAVPATELGNVNFATFDGQDYCYWYPREDDVQYLYETFPEVINPVEGVENEHFIVWMRTAGLPQFRKLYGRIEQDIAKGTVLRFEVLPRFIVDEFDGKKFLVVSTTSWFGGKNPFLGIAYIVVGTLCLVLAIVFAVKHKIAPRKLGDTRYLVWKDQ